jgi:hypothetical protein
MDTSALASTIMSMSAAGTRMNVQTSLLKQQFDFQKQAVATLLQQPQAAPAAGTGRLVDKTV